MLRWYEQRHRAFGGVAAELVGAERDHVAGDTEDALPVIWFRSSRADALALALTPVTELFSIAESVIIAEIGVAPVTNESPMAQR